MAKNKMSDLRNHLFEALEKLGDDENPMDPKRAAAISQVAQTIIDSAKVEIQFMEAIGEQVSADFFGDTVAIEGGNARRSLSRGQ